jgi:hypothetical protein
MKKIYTLSATLIFFCYASSQTQFGIFAGPQATASRYTILNEKQKQELKYSFRTGACLKMPFENNLYFAPEIFYSMKGYKVTFTQFVYPPGVNAINNNTTIHTFELAALLQYDFGRNPGHVYMKAGPSLDFQLFGREKFDTVGGGTVDRKMKFSFNGDYGYIGANLLLHLGYEAPKGFFISAQYTHGAGSINNEDKGPKIRHRVYGFTIGKYLNRNKIVVDTRNKE